MKESFALGGRSALGSDGRRLLTRWFELILLWDERQRGRRSLLAMDDARLKDIGISRTEAQAEALKPFWRA